MRLTPSFNLPDELERARTAGELIVFAGAGVSMGQPASMPGFVDYARRIAEPTVSWDEKYKNQLDVYLGVAERRRVLVQARAREILRPDGRPHNALHEDLVGLFTSSDRVRLITTNFDLFFDSAARLAFPGATIARYTGPALPPGQNFAGIAYLHGALDNAQDPLVLTDRDFAAAYLADGWAARFLLAAFPQRTVLFAGYRLGDPVMRYLMRAMNPTGRWYALCHEEDQASWTDMSIIPVPFATAPDGDRFRELNDGIKRWRSYARASVADHDRDLRKMILGGPPQSPQDEDYVRTRLSTDAGRQTFWSTDAPPAAWLGWIADGRHIDVLFDPNSDDATIPGWGDWCLRCFSGGPKPPLLSLLRRTSLTLNRFFARQLALHLAREALPADATQQLVALLANQQTLSHQSHEHIWLVEKLTERGFAGAAMLLLRTLTRIRLGAIEFPGNFEYDGGESDDESPLPELSNRVVLAADSAELVRILEKSGAELGAIAAAAMLRLGIERIAEAYDILNAARSVGSGMDWLSFGRVAIAPSGQDASAHAEDVLVLLVRAAIDAFSQSNPGALFRFAESHSVDERMLLRRLALYAFSKDRDLTADALLDRARAEGWSRIVWIRPEMYAALKVHFPRATDAAQRRYIADLQRDEWGPGFDEGDIHARFSLSQMLERVAPESAAAREFADGERTAHPNFAEGDRDGFLSRVEAGWGGRDPSPIDAEEMVRWNVEHALEQISLAWQTSRDREALLGALQEAAETNPSWGTAFFALATAHAQAEANADYITSIGWGLHRAKPSVEEMRSFLDLCANTEWPTAAAHAVSFAVDQWSRSIPAETQPDLLDAFDRAADAIFARSSELQPGISDRGWFERAINHPAGHAAQVWLHVAEFRDRVEGSFVLSVDDKELARWERVLSDRTAAGSFARPILGMAAERLSAGDHPWSERLLFPAFSVEAFGERAAQLWDGRLFQRNWTWSVASGLRPHWPALLGESATLLPARSRELGDVVALLVAHHSETGFSLSLLHDFIRGATPEARQSFADALPRHLERLNPEQRQTLWREILKPYWIDRRTNVPVSLDPDEVREMLSWIPALPEVATDVIGELELTECGPMRHADMLLFRWKDASNDWVRERPAEAVAIIGFLANRQSIPAWSVADTVTQLEVAFSAGAPRNRLLRVTEQIATFAPIPIVMGFIERLREAP